MIPGRQCSPVKMLDFDRLRLMRPGFKTAPRSERYSAQLADAVLVVLKARGCPLESHWLIIGCSTTPTFFGTPIAEAKSYIGILATTPTVYDDFDRGNEFFIRPFHIVDMVRAGGRMTLAEMNRRRRVADMRLASHLLGKSALPARSTVSL